MTPAGKPRRSARTRIAQANVAASLGGGRNGGGGMFIIRNIGIRSAQLVFRGWNRDFRGDVPQQFEINQSGESSLEMAVVNKVIEIIRQRQSGNFVFTSVRLGRDVNLSARVEDTAGLQDFLMREFQSDFDPEPGRPDGRAGPRSRGPPASRP